MKFRTGDLFFAKKWCLDSIIGHLIDQRSTWTDDFFTAIQTKIDKALEVHLGIDSAKDLRGATQVLKSIQKQALKDLAEVKVQIAEDYKKEPVKQLEIPPKISFQVFKRENKISFCVDFYFINIFL